MVTMRRLIPLLALALVAGPIAAADEVVVYSARKDHLIKPLFDAFTAETSIPVRFITDKEGPLLERLKAEGPSTPADMLITVDAGNLWMAAEAGVLAPLRSETLERNVPANLRDPEGRWFGLSVRARTIVYVPGRVSPTDLSTYEALADPRWKGRLCLRTSKKVYNQSLVAALISRLGEAETERVVRGWVANLATDPFADDTKVLEALAAGLCEVGVVNTYYYGRYMQEHPEPKLSIFWPNQATSGVHVNVSGAGITRYAKHPKEAQRLLEWLSSPKAQGIFASLNLEVPASPGIPVDPTVGAWGSFRSDPLNVSELGRLQAQAVMLMDRAGYR
jgi:iron(III) transport system substrate-binding protein